MTDLTRIGLIDLAVLLAVVGAVVGALRARRGLLGAAGGAVGALLACWLVVTAVVVWGPTPVSGAVERSAFVDTFPVPDRAIDDVRRLDGPDSPGPR